MILVHKTGNTGALMELGTVFIEEKTNSFLPYFVAAVRPKKENELYLKLEEINTREAAGKLLQKRVYLPEKDFRRVVAGDSILYYLGFSVQDKQAGTLGNVSEVIEMPSQLLLKVYRRERELLIPLNEETLLEISGEKKVIFVNLPDGLLDIYQA